MQLPPLSRRGVLLSLLSATAMGSQAGAQTLRAAAGRRPTIKALAFDGFTLLDPRPVGAAVSPMVPDKGAQLAAAWAHKLLALSWLETSAGRYSGFAAIAEAALTFSAEAMDGFVAFGGWDALGAKWFGDRTVWINRLGVREETLAPYPDAMARDLSALAALRAL